MTPSLAPHTPTLKEPPLLVGVGSARGDDQIGWIVAEQVRERWSHVAQVRVTTVPLDLLDWMTPTKELHIVDACDGNAAPGRLHRWNWSSNGNRSAENHDSAEFLLRGTGTHDFDVVSVLELARCLERLPPSVTIWGIQGERWTESASVSPTVAAVLADVSEFIAKELVDARTITGTLAADAG